MPPNHHQEVQHMSHRITYVLKTGRCHNHHQDILHMLNRITYFLMSQIYQQASYGSVGIPFTFQMPIPNTYNQYFLLSDSATYILAKQNICISIWYASFILHMVLLTLYYMHLQCQICSSGSGADLTTHELMTRWKLQG